MVEVTSNRKKYELEVIISRIQVRDKVKEPFFFFFLLWESWYINYVLKYKGYSKRIMYSSKGNSRWTLY